MQSVRYRHTSDTTTRRGVFSTSSPYVKRGLYSRDRGTVKHSLAWSLIMRTSIVLGGLAATVLSIFLLRQHIQVLSEVVRTYATFYPYLDSHPDTLYRYHSDITEAPHMDIDVEARVPRMIHQIHLSEGRPSVLGKHQAAIDSCRQVHGGWNHTIWTDETASTFMQSHYPSIYPHYRGYPQSIQRANILRYALLDHFGGVYIDLDVTCRQSLEPLRDISWLSPGAHPAGVNNAFIQARRGHPFLRHLLSAVPSRDITWGLPYIENMLSTGCMFYSNMWMSYARSHVSSDPIDRVRILADEQGNIESHMLRGIITTPLFKHGGASSWHGWDAAAIVIIGKYYSLIFQLFLVSCLVTGLIAWRCMGARNRRRRSSWNSIMKGTLSPVESPPLSRWSTSVEKLPSALV
jgi:mannosyltransferase OCH1-like enzyme